MFAYLWLTIYDSLLSFSLGSQGFVPLAIKGKFETTVGCWPTAAFL